MADKGKLKHELHTAQRVKTWQLVLLFVLSLVIAATFLRLNNVGMHERRMAVLAADEEGTVEDVQNRLVDLQRYASKHMNADTGHIWLVEQYKKEVERRKKKAEQQGTDRNTTQQKVARVCDELGRQGGWYWPDQRYIDCVDKQFEKYPAAPNYLASIEPPDRNQYRHEYISPLWTPDFAGFAVLTSGLLALAILLRITVVGILRLLLRRHFKAS